MTAMGIILTFIVIMLVIAAGMILISVMSELFNVFCDKDEDEDDKEEDL